MIQRMARLMGSDGASASAKSPCFSYYSRLEVRGAVRADRRRFSAVASSEFVITFPTCLWDAAESNARQAKVTYGGLKVDAPGVAIEAYLFLFR